MRVSQGHSLTLTGSQVCVRCRPRNTKELEEKSPVSVEVKPELQAIDAKVKTGGKLDTKTYTFDKVFGPDSNQVKTSATMMVYCGEWLNLPISVPKVDVYKAVAEPLLEEVLAGYNCTIFAYGQTGELQAV